jgi:cytochrome c-type biogenesis protein CcmH
VSIRALFVAVSLALLCAGAVHAVEPNERLADPVLEARARAISKELRCLVCQNESIDDSAADLAHDLRVLLRERIAQGDTDAQAIQFIVARYGNFVLLRPPVLPATYVLWFGPLALRVIGALGTFIYLRRRAPAEAVSPLSDAERRRVDQLLDQG